MKRIGNLFKNICDIDNLLLADTKARKGKRNTRGVLKHDKVQDTTVVTVDTTTAVLDTCATVDTAVTK